MNSRERVALALDHEETDHIPLDLGGSVVTGMHVSMVYSLRQALKLDKIDTPVKIIEPYMMLGEIAPDLREKLGVDVVQLISRTTIFGFKNENWKPWRLSDGTPVLVPGKFNTEYDAECNIDMYPQGDLNVSPCAHMPKSSFFFDAIPKQQSIDWNNLDPRENLEEFNVISNDELEYFRFETQRLYYKTDKAIFANLHFWSGFGDLVLIFGLQLKHPKGIRSPKAWFMSHIRKPDYIRELFELQCEIALENLRKISKVVGNRITATFVTGTDFGTQRGPIMSVKTYRKLYKPFHKTINDWIHENTTWKTFIHSCGSIEPLIKDFVEAGFDILNPVQISAANMEPCKLKAKFGDRIVFWGGGVDSQYTLPFGTIKRVQREVQTNLRIFAQGGGFVFSTIHNIQPRTPIKNVLAMYNTFHKHKNIIFD